MSTMDAKRQTKFVTCLRMPTNRPQIIRPLTSLTCHSKSPKKVNKQVIASITIHIHLIMGFLNYLNPHRRQKKVAAAAASRQKNSIQTIERNRSSQQQIIITTTSSRSRQPALDRHHRQNIKVNHQTIDLSKRSNFRRPQPTRALV